MFFLQEAIAAGPLFLAGIVFILIIIGVAFFVLVELFKNYDKPGLKELKEDMGEPEALKELKARRTVNFFLMSVLILIAFTLYKLLHVFFNLTYS